MNDKGVVGDVEAEVIHHVHAWRVVSFERESQVIGYRCRGCGEERFEHPGEPLPPAA